MEVNNHLPHVPVSKYTICLARRKNLYIRIHMQTENFVNIRILYMRINTYALCAGMDESIEIVALDYTFGAVYPRDCARNARGILFE